MKYNSGLLFILLLLCYACSEPVDPFEAYQKGNYKVAINGLTDLSEQGNLDAMTHLGVIYQIGLGIDKDLDMAFSFYKRAADNNHAPAQYNLGLLYQSGLGVKQDYAVAYKLFTLAAEQGHHKAKSAAESLLTELKVTFPE